MSEEKVLTLRGKKAVWAPGGGSGPIDPKRLPEGYPYKEGSKTVIEWDGDTAGRYSVLDMFYHVSDEVISDEIIKNGTLTFSNGNTSPANIYWDAYVEAGVITEDISIAADANIIVVRKAGAQVSEFGPFEKTGVYFPYHAEAGGVYTSKFVSENETIHPMAEEFLPALTSPNGTKYQLTVADDGTLSAVAVS